MLPEINLSGEEDIDDKEDDKEKVNAYFLCL